MAYIKCSSEVHQLVKVKAAQEGKQMQEYVDDAIRQRLSKTDSMSTKEPDESTTSKGVGENLTPPDGNFVIYFNEILNSSVLNSKLDTILAILDKQAHGKDQNRADQRRSLERQLEKFIKTEAAVGRRVAASGKAGKRVRGRSTGNVPPLRTGSD